ncbi:MAG: hypothetical protein WDM89_02080 [Rhizomicrobium sp.]
MISASRIAFVAALAASVSGIALASPVLQFHSDKIHHGAPRGTDRKLSVLYDQTFERLRQCLRVANSGSNVTAAADDFVVPKGHTWSVKEVDVIGKYYDGYGPNKSENVTFYADDNGKPGKTVKNGTLVNLSGADDGGSLAIAFPKGVKLKPGHYWVSVVANLDFNDGGEWGWELQTTHEGDDAVYQNGSSGWTAIGSGDLMFTLKGKSK